MKKIMLLIGVLLSVFLVLPFVLAEDEPLGYPCLEDQECLDFFPEYEDNIYCDLVAEECYMYESVYEMYFSEEEASDEEMKISSGTDTASSITNLSTKVGNITTQVNQLDIRVGAIEEDNIVIKEQLDSLSTKVDELDSSISAQIGELNSGISDLNSNLETLNNQQLQAEDTLNIKVSGVSTGLAALQGNLSSTNTALGTVKEDLGKKGVVLNLVTFLVLLVIFVSAAIIATYYFTHEKKLKQKYAADLTPRIKNYLTQQIKIGKKFSQIQDELKQQGWGDEEIRWAYRETMKHNYNQYLNKSDSKSYSSSPSSPLGFLQQLENKLHYNDVIKVMVVLTVSIIIVVGMVFLIKGNTGQAIYFNDAGMMNSAAMTLLQQNINQNQFYPLVGTVNICLQVKDGDKSVSFRVMKSLKGHTIKPLSKQCDEDSSRYDFGVKFTNWESFRNTVSSLNCETLRKANFGKQNIIFLPSRYILPGFALNPERDASRYCKVLEQCLSEGEIRKVCA